MSKKAPVLNRTIINTNGAPVAEPPPPAKGKTLVVIEKPSIEVVKVPIQGTRSLIVQAWTEKAIRKMLDDQMQVGKGKPKKARDPKDPQKDFEQSRYISTQGWDGMKAGAFRTACIDACRFVGGLPMTRAKGLIFVIADGRSVPREYKDIGVRFGGDDLVRIHGEPEMRMDMARNDNGSADIRFRAEYWPWRAILTIRYNAGEVSAQDIFNLVAIAGETQGIGEMRPSSPENKSGDHGTWELAK